MLPSRNPAARVAGTLILTLCAIPGVWAEKTEPEQGSRSPYERATRPKTTDPDGPAKVYTTDDLERLYADQRDASKAKPAKTRPPSGEANDPLALLKQQQAEQADRKQQIADAERKVAEADTRVRELEQRILATKNPLLARPKIPDDEKAEWSGQDAAQRVASSERKLEQARQELRKAEAELRRLRTGR